MMVLDDQGEQQTRLYAKTGRVYAVGSCIQQ